MDMLVTLSKSLVVGIATISMSTASPITMQMIPAVLPSFLT